MMFGESYQNVFLIQIDALSFAEFEITEFEISRVDCILLFSENFAQKLSTLTELATKYPNLRDAYLTKSQVAAHKFEFIAEEERVRAQLDDIQPLFKEIEDQLQKIKEGRKLKSSQGNDEYRLEHWEVERKEYLWI